MHAPGRLLADARDLPATLLALARPLRDHFGCRHLALTPLHTGREARVRLVANLAADPPALSAHDGDRLAGLLTWLEHEPQPWRWGAATRPVPPPLEGFAPDAAAVYWLLPLICRGERIGLLELGGTAALGESHAEIEGLLPTLALAVDGLLAHEQAAELQARLDREVVYLRDELKAERDLRSLTGDSPAMRAVRLAIQQVARTDSTVLILGETGTGKELVARAIHQLSARRDRLLVAVNCAALSPGVVPSELFGHEAGAYTGATRRRVGRFELAHGGTLFLDEVAEIGPETQVLLLRALQEKTVERVGGNDPVRVDVRLIAATHPGLPRAVADGRFRADLFYRLNVFPIHVPPLRDRRDDLPDLLKHFLHHFNRRMGKRVTHVPPEAVARLAEYAWPGNVRELENLIERAMIVSTGDTLHLDPSWLAPLPGSVAPAAPTASLRDQERQTILAALERTGGKIYGPDGAAARLGLKPTTLYGKMRKHGITRPGDPAE